MMMIMMINNDGLGYMGTWVHGYMGTWVQGYMGTWVYIGTLACGMSKTMYSF